MLASFPQKQGSDFMSRYIWEFWDFVDDFGLINLPLLGGLCTWSCSSRQATSMSCSWGILDQYQTIVFVLLDCGVII